MKKFRPQWFIGRWKLKYRNPVGQWHWVEHKHHATHIKRIHAQLHYLACHAPLPIQKKWKHVWNMFEKKYRKKL